MAPIQLWTVEAINRAFTATWEGRANARKNRLRAFAISTQSPDNRLMTPAANVERIAPNDAQRHGGARTLTAESPIVARRLRGAPYKGSRQRERPVAAALPATIGYPGYLPLPRPRVHRASA